MAFAHAHIPVIYARQTTVTSTSLRPATLNLRRCSFAKARWLQPVEHSAVTESTAITAPWVMNISTSDFRVGTTIELEGIPFRVLEFLHVKPGKGAAFVRTKLKNMKTGNNVDKTFKAGESVQTAMLEKSTMQHTYVDGDDFVFMNVETFDEERMTASVLGESVVKFLSMGLEVEVLKHNTDVIGVELPKSLTFSITSTEPGAKGNTAQGNVLKPAIIETGAEVMVPLFINSGEKIRVNTEDGKYLGRSSE